MNLRDFFVSGEKTITDVLKRMDITGYGILLVGDGKKMKAVITDGDIRRAIIGGYSEENKVCDIANYNPLFLKTSEATKARIKAFFNEKRIKCIPVIGGDGEIHRLEFDNGNKIYREVKNDIKVVIMAGGRGKRLFPLTDILPKPLIPVGDETILERIINRLGILGFWDFNIIINYKKEIIKAFFAEGVYENVHNTNIRLWEETIFQGTAGGLKLLQKELTNTFILSNCDILVDTDYEDMVEEHKKEKNYITMVCALQNIKIPYGVVKADENNEVITLEEKPSIKCLANTGLYVVEPQVLSLIGEEEVLDFPELIQRCMERRYRIGIYKIPEEAWLDMGEMSKLAHMENEFL